MNLFVSIARGGFSLSLLTYLPLKQRRKGRLAKFFLQAAPLFWGVYGIWECIAMSAGWNIRVDLLLIFPILLFITIGTGISAFTVMLHPPQKQKHDLHA